MIQIQKKTLDSENLNNNKITRVLTIIIINTTKNI